MSRRKSNIIVLGTGGTLASIASDRLSSKYDTAAIPVEALLADLPELMNIATISSEQVAQINSENMTEAVWLTLAKRTQALANSDDIDGIVITHGTDTMEETAFFLNCVVHTKKPIVFTGAMRPANAVSADGLKNLFNAIVLAASSESYDKGVLVTLNDIIHHSRDVTKTNVNSVDAFKSPELGILGYLHDGEPHYYRSVMKPHTDASEFSVNDIEALPKVHIVYGYVGNNAALVNACVEDNAAGIISAGVGQGYQPEITTNALIEARKNGVIIVRCSRVRNGIISRDPKIDDQHDFVVSHMLSAQKARILLALALTKTNSTDEIQDIFNRY